VSNRARILEEALNTDLITAPRRVPTPPNANTTKHCWYHRNYGHTTEDCFTLKDKIEELIQAGHLRRFVKREGGRFSFRGEREKRYGEQPRRTSGYREREGEGTRRRAEPKKDDKRDKRERPLRGVINYILGGFAGGGATTSTRKKYVREIQSVNAVTVCPRWHMPPITFRDDDFQAIDPQHDDPMVISVEIEDFAIRKTLVDPGSSVDILYWSTFRKLRIPEGKIQQYSEPIVGFSGERVNTKGYVDLFTKFGTGSVTRMVKIRYLIVDAHTSYNILLGRPSLNTLGAVVSTYHLAMKFSSALGDIITVHVDQLTARRCYVDSLRERQFEKVLEEAEIDLDPRVSSEERVEPIESTEEFHFDEHWYTHVSKTLVKTPEMWELLQRNVDLFAWSATDMPGIDPRVASHKLSIFREARPVAQKRRKMGGEKREAAKAEVQKLISVGFIKEATYTTWLANVVLVKKANGKWRMCTDYTDLNKACPKDMYPLPSIDRLVDGAAGHKVLSFLDAYSGYNQIPMYPLDKEKQCSSRRKLTSTMKSCLLA